MSQLVESPEERRARYRRMAIAAAAAARVPTAKARSAYLILAETWSSLAHADEPEEPAGAAPAAAGETTPSNPDNGPDGK